MTNKEKKLAKDINVPRKEQIMIDGVDVNRCIDFNKRDKVSCYHILYDKCNENPNCYFKQLTLKTQECESLNKRASSLEEIADDLQQRNHHLTQECEELKKQLMQKSEVYKKSARWWNEYNG